MLIAIYGLDRINKAIQPYEMEDGTVTLSCVVNDSDLYSSLDDFQKNALVNEYYKLFLKLNKPKIENDFTDLLAEVSLNKMSMN